MSATSTGADRIAIRRCRPVRSTQYTCPGRLCSRNAVALSTSASPRDRRLRSSIRVSSSDSGSSSSNACKLRESSAQHSPNRLSTGGGAPTVRVDSRAPSPVASGSAWNRLPTASHIRAVFSAASPAFRCPSNPFPVSGV